MKINRLKSVILVILFTHGLAQAAEWPIGEFVKVIMKSGASLRDAPASKGKKLTVLKYGDKAAIVEATSVIEDVPFAYGPVRGYWIKVSFQNYVGYLFSPTIERDILNQYSCPKPQKYIKQTSMHFPGVEIEFCSDGTYLMDNNYLCYGSCWEHGCWAVDSKKRLLLQKRKTARTIGVGKPISCTHACRHEIYTIESEGFPESTPRKAHSEYAEFLDYYHSGPPINPNRKESTQSASKPSCRDSIH